MLAKQLMGADVPIITLEKLARKGDLASLMHQDLQSYQKSIVVNQPFYTCSCITRIRRR